MDTEDIHIRRPLRQILGRLQGWIDDPQRAGEEAAAVRQRLETLQVAVTYLLFDLHATRLENEHLRCLLADAFDPDPGHEGPE